MNCRNIVLDSTGDFTLDSGSDIILDAGTNNVKLMDYWWRIW